MRLANPMLGMGGMGNPNRGPNINKLQRKYGMPSNPPRDLGVGGNPYGGGPKTMAPAVMPQVFNDLPVVGPGWANDPNTPDWLKTMMTNVNSPLMPLLTGNPSPYTPSNPEDLLYSQPQTDYGWGNYGFDQNLVNYLNQNSRMSEMAPDLGRWQYDPTTQTFTNPGAFTPPGMGVPTKTLAEMQQYVSPFDFTGYGQDWSNYGLDPELTKFVQNRNAQYAGSDVGQYYYNPATQTFVSRGGMMQGGPTYANTPTMTLQQMQQMQQNSAMRGGSFGLGMAGQLAPTQQYAPYGDPNQVGLGAAPATQMGMMGQSLMGQQQPAGTFGQMGGANPYTINQPATPMQPQPSNPWQQMREQGDRREPQGQNNYMQGNQMMNRPFAVRGR